MRAETLCELVTEDLQQATSDKHLRLLWSDELQEVDGAEEDEEFFADPSPLGPSALAPWFGDGPRYATAACARAADEAREQGQRMAADSASGIPLELLVLVTALPAGDGPIPGEIVEHQAHAIGHAAVLLADRGVLLVGDMLSDVLIPILDPRRPGQMDAYQTALDQLSKAARHVNVLIPGHGTVAEGPEVAARLAADQAYMDALRRGEEPADARLSQDWLSCPHQSNLKQARGQ